MSNENTPDKHELTDYQGLLEKLWGQPEDVVDFKAPFNLNNCTPQARAKLAKHVMGLSNREKGGYIIIGKEDKTATAISCDDDVINSFDPTNFHNKIKDFSDPSPNVKVVVGKSPAKTDAILLVVKEFSDSPLICVKQVDAKDQNKPPVTRCGALYIRTATGSAETREISNAEEMRNLIHRATLKDKESMISKICQILEGISSPDAMITKQNEQIWSADESTVVDCMMDFVKEPCIQIIAHPVNHSTRLFSPVDLKKKIADNIYFHRGWSFPCPDFEFKNTAIDPQSDIVSLKSSRPFGSSSVNSAFAATTSGMVGYREDLYSGFDEYSSASRLNGGELLSIPWVLIVLFRAINFIGRFFDLGPESPQIHIKVEMRGIYGRNPYKEVYHSLNHVHPYHGAEAIKSSYCQADLILTSDLFTLNPNSACFKISEKLLTQMGIQISAENLKKDIAEIAKS